MSTKLNGSKDCYVSLTIQWNMSFVYTLLNDQTGLFQTIQFCINIQFFVYTRLNVSKFGNRSRGWPEVSLVDSYYAKM